MPYNFQGQHRGEEVVLVSHQHPFMLAHAALVVAGIVLVPFLANVFLYVSTPLIIITATSWLTAVIAAYLYWYTWQNSLLLVTTERVMFLKQKGLFGREFTECALYSVQQVSHTINGIIPTVLGFGTLVINTAGAQAPFLIPGIPDPYDIQQEIMRVAQEEVQG